MGTWEFVSAETVAPDGKKSPTFGMNPKGIVIFEATGHSALIVTRSDAPKFASNNRMSSISRGAKLTMWLLGGRGLDGEGTENRQFGERLHVSSSLFGRIHASVAGLRAFEAGSNRR